MCRKDANKRRVKRQNPVETNAQYRTLKTTIIIAHLQGIDKLKLLLDKVPLPKASCVDMGYKALDTAKYYKKYRKSLYYMRCRCYNII